MLRNDGKYFLSDTEMIVCNQLTDKEAKRLVYFTNLKYLDVGHGYFSSMDFLASLPKLEVLIIALNLAEDLSPIACCTELEYLEVFSTRVSDISALAGLTKLEHLNISNLNGLTDLSPLYGLENLKRLRGTMNGRLPDEQTDQIRQMLPNCIIEFGEDGDRDPTGGCWRYDAEGNYVERYALLREQFQYGK